MNKNTTGIIATLGLLACSPEDATPLNDENINITHRVCALDDESQLKSNVGIDKSLDWLLIQGLSVAPGDIDLDSKSDEEAFTAAFAVTAFLAPGLTDSFNILNSLYVCTEASYALDQCQWQIEGEERVIRVSTVVDGQQNYTTTVVANDGVNDQTQLVIDGVIGDLGNLTMSFYDEGILNLTRESSRSAGGTETVQYTSATTNWTATETSACSGSLTFESVEDDITTNVDASWSLNGSSTSGTLEFFKTGMEAAYHTNW